MASEATSSLGNYIGPFGPVCPFAQRASHSPAPSDGIELRGVVKVVWLLENSPTRIIQLRLTPSRNERVIGLSDDSPRTGHVHVRDPTFEAYLVYGHCRRFA